jgi:hypothetical protein
LTARNYAPNLLRVRAFKHFVQGCRDLLIAGKIAGARGSAPFAISYSAGRGKLTIRC